MHSLAIKKAELDRRLAELASGNRSDATKIAYARDFIQFEQWCLEMDADCLPADPGTLATYLVYMNETGKAPSTIRRAMTSIRQAHRLAGETTPINDAVREVEKGIRRERGIAQNKAKPLLLEQLEIVLSRIPSDFIGIRDKAIILIGFLGAFRRSEIVSIDLEHIEEVPQGIVITLPRSKTDQEGEGRLIPIPWVHDTSLCAVTALRKWLDVAQIRTGPVFRAIGPGGHALLYKAKEKPLSAKSVNVIIKRHVRRSGFDAAKYSGHSLRSGFITSAAASGVSETAIMSISGHHSTAVMRGYIREGRLFLNHPAYLMLGPNKIQENVRDPSSSTE